MLSPTHSPPIFAGPILAGMTLALLAGCRAPRGVHFYSDPPGAQVVLDGRDTGFVTPCILDLKNKPEREVSFVLPGYAPARRSLKLDTRTTSVFWKDATVFYATWRFPLWLRTEDFWLPVKLQGGEFPKRVFVRLRREADRPAAPLGG